MATNSFFNQFSPKHIQFMDDCERGNLKDIARRAGDEVLPCHISEFDFIATENGDAAVFTVAEMPGVFYFAPSQVTEFFHAVADANMGDALKAETVAFTIGTSKKRKVDYIVINVL